MRQITTKHQAAKTKQFEILRLPFGIYLGFEING
jgi:hypothetical protein